MGPTWAHPLPGLHLVRAWSAPGLHLVCIYKLVLICHAHTIHKMHIEQIKKLFMNTFRKMHLAFHVHLKNPIHKMNVFVSFQADMHVHE